MQSESLIGEQEAIVEKKLVDEFMREIRNDGLVEYGEARVRECLQKKNVRKLLVSEEVMDRYKDLISAAGGLGVDVCYLSIDSQDGQIFLQSFHGLGSFVRYHLP